MLQLPFCLRFAVFLTFDDNSRNWTSFLANSRNWQLARGCTVIEGTRFCDDGVGGGTRDYTIYFQSAGIHIRSRSVVPGDYNLARTIKIGPKSRLSDECGFGQPQGLFKNSYMQGFQQAPIDGRRNASAQLLIEVGYFFSRKKKQLV